VDPAFPPTTIYVVAAALAAVILTLTVAFVALNPFRIGAPGNGMHNVDPALIEAGRQWELERKQQSGWIDPVIESAREWERQRNQQSPY
jgi:hypothetical protein